jgi:hypothetical protein
MQTVIGVDYTKISNLISDCDSAIHAAEGVKKGTLGGVREHVQKAIDEAVAFIGLLPPDVSNVYAESIRILNARRGVLSNLLDRLSSRPTSRRGKHSSRYGSRMR